jgi:hypothetical protein
MLRNAALKTTTQKFDIELCDAENMVNRILPASTDKKSRRVTYFIE